MRPEDCPELENCPKVRMIRDKDLLDFQYAEAIRSVCEKCQGGQNEMNKCPKCGAATVRASSYDPDGLIPLYGGGKEYNGVGSLKEWWFCINLGCEDGRRNRM